MLNREKPSNPQPQYPPIQLNSNPYPLTNWPKQVVTIKESFIAIQQIAKTIKNYFGEYCFVFWEKFKKYF